MSDPSRSTDRVRLVLAALGIVAGAVAVAVAVGGGKSDRESHTPIEPPPTARPEHEPNAEDIARGMAAVVERIQEIDTIGEAIDFARPMMGGNEDEVSKGTLLMEMWANGRMKWSDVALAQDETTIGEVKKDPDSAHGKRLCVTGVVHGIEVAKSWAGRPWLGMMEANPVPVHFVAVGSSGKIVDGSQARVCGVVTGMVQVATLRAVQVVGLFDLPENRARFAAPATGAPAKLKAAPRSSSDRALLDEMMGPKKDPAKIGADEILEAQRKASQAP